MEAQKKLITLQAGQVLSDTAAPEQNSNKLPARDDKKRARLSTNERKAASEDMRYLNAEQDEEQLRKDEEARRNHKSQ